MDHRARPGTGLGAVWGARSGERRTLAPGPQRAQRGKLLSHQLSVALTLLLCSGLLLELPALRSIAYAGPEARGLAVASESPRAAQEAMRVLRSGGNAVDAAVTAALVAGVTSSSSSGIGGGGFANYWDATTKQVSIIDFRETAPAAIDAQAFDARPFKWDERGKWVGVPGEVRGLYLLHARSGNIPWEDLVRVAANVARTGFVVNRHVARTLRASRGSLVRDPGLAALWFPGGRRLPPAAGRLWKNPTLARTLERIASEGPKALYQGSIAADIVNTARARGSAMQLADLDAYQPVDRAPLQLEWHGHTVYTMPPPSAGGYMLAHTLRLYTPRELKKLGHNTPAYIHALAESFRAALADRFTFFGDPDYEPLDVERLLDSERLKARRAAISLYRTHTIPAFAQNEHGTHHLITADGAGNVVSLTSTVNRGFGAKLMTTQSGIVLNDELDDFSSNAAMGGYGRSQSPNRARPGARPVSSMTPTIVVKDGQAVLAAGGSGGMTIATNVTQTVISQLLFGRPPQELVAAERFRVPAFGPTLELPRTMPAGIEVDLRKRGEIIQRFRPSTSAVQMISLAGNRRFAGADPNKFGEALAE